MLSKEVLRRISELNRQAPASQVAEAHGPSPHAVDAGAVVAKWRAQLARARQAGQPTNARPGESMSPPAWREPVHDGNLHDLPPGRELETPVGAHYIIERPLDELWRQGQRWLQRWSRSRRVPVASGQHIEPPARREPKWLADLNGLRQALPDSVMFLDLETCGFSGSMVFLVGLLVAGPKGMTLVQLFARHYGEERAIMHTLWQIASQQTVLATYNGKSFDWPVVRDRTVLHRLERHGPLAEEEIAHCDLLHQCRRQWRHELPNCKLQTLERHICGRRRTGDIPGRDIPDAYHQYVRSRDAYAMRGVLHHNALDLVTLFQLTLTLLEREELAIRESA
ncbi:MAG: ribonuclease H-like domain-containing protein [Planctomycetales bacterium]|nr:ribonuclease H-like domain-containing protein [Planctomycetales bacterium]